MKRRRVTALIGIVCVGCLLLLLQHLSDSSNQSTTELFALPGLTLDTTLVVPNEPHVAFVLCGAARLPDVKTFLKSIAIFHNAPVTFHAFVERSLQENFSQQFSEIVSILPSMMPNTPQDWTMHMYDAEPPPGVPKEFKNFFRPCASMRLFLPDLLPPTLPVVLYLDVDSIVMNSLSHLWKELAEFDESQLVGIALETEEPHTGYYAAFAQHPFYKDTGLNSGVLLMRLDRMRAINWADQLIKIHSSYKDVLTFGDQDLINIHANSTPESIHPLSCVYNFRWDHCRDHLGCLPAVARGPSIVHGNRGFFHSTGLDGDKKGDPAFYMLWKHVNQYDLATGHLRLDLYNPLKEAFHFVSTRSSCAKLYPLFLRPLEKLMRHDVER